MEMILTVMKEYMTRHGISNAEVAQKCGWSETRFSSMLNGFLPINASDYGTICKAIGVKPSLFYILAKGLTLFQGRIKIV